MGKKLECRDRICDFCKKEFLLKENGGGFKYCSKKCSRDSHYNRWKSNGGRRCPIKSRSYLLKFNYGITIEDFNIMFEAQGSMCKICKNINTTGKNWHVDHSHSSGKIRGILCSSCNQALGLVRENIKTLNNMIDYLEVNNEQ